MAANGSPNSKHPALQIDGKAWSSENSIDSDRERDTVPAEVFDKPTSPVYSIPTQQVIEINRKLVNQIDILKMKVKIDENKREVVRKDFLESSNQNLKIKEIEIENLKYDLKEKEKNVQNLTDENQRKNTEIIRLQKYVDDLKRDVQASKKYADDIQRHLDLLPKVPLKKELAYVEQDSEIGKLRTEVNNLKKYLATLEEELSKAKEKIAQQGSKIQFLEIDGGNIQIKFKEDLAKVTQIVRNEIEKSRDIMSKQWEEMRKLRKQNENMRQDIREIREMITSTHSPRASQDHAQGPSTSLTNKLPLVKLDINKTAQGKKKIW